MSILVDKAWIIGFCCNCLKRIDPNEIKKRNVAFCSEHCRKQAEKVRYIRQAIRDGRSCDPITTFTIFNNMIVFLAYDLAYVRPRVTGALRKAVLSRDKGMCVVCRRKSAVEIDHISGGSNDPSNLRGICRACHELKPRGEIPADLTRDRLDSVDASEESRELIQSWRAALFSFSPLGESPEWSNLQNLAKRYENTRFGWITLQIFAERALSPAHDGIRWRGEWPVYRKMYLEWAAQNRK